MRVILNVTFPDLVVKSQKIMYIVKIKVNIHVFSTNTNLMIQSKLRDEYTLISQFLQLVLNLLHILHN